LSVLDSYRFIGKVGSREQKTNMDCKTSHLPAWQDNKTAGEKAGLAGHDEKSAFLNDNTKNQQTMDMQQIFANRLMPVAFALPWVMGMLISWVPFTKISLNNAPDFLYVHHKDLV
jgi:hypothetical protein